MAMNQRHRGAAQRGQGIEDAVTTLNSLQDLILGGVGLEFVEIRADHEACRLARSDQHAARRLNGNAFQGPTEFLQDFAPQAVGRGAGAVQRQREYPIGILLMAPVREPQSLEHRLTCSDARQNARLTSEAAVAVGPHRVGLWLFHRPRAMVTT